ncbi:MAG: hypothetical protein ACTSSP_00390 [Candidatus Asgardarchaeia archaeon]
MDTCVFTAEKGCSVKFYPYFPCGDRRQTNCLLLGCFREAAAWKACTDGRLKACTRAICCSRIIAARHITEKIPACFLFFERTIMKKTFLFIMILLLLPSVASGESKRTRRRRLLKDRRTVAQRKLIQNRKNRSGYSPRVIRQHPYNTYNCAHSWDSRRAMYNLQYRRDWRKFRNRTPQRRTYRKESPICNGHSPPKYETNLYRRKHTKTPKHWSK